MLWLYRRSGEPYLLELAQLLRKQGCDWIAEFESFPIPVQLRESF